MKTSGCAEAGATRWNQSFSLIVALLVSLLATMACAPRVMAARRANRRETPHAFKAHPFRPGNRAATARSDGWTPVHVRPGETLSGIFKAQGFSATDVARLLATTRDKRSLEDLRPGETLWLESGPGGRFEAIRYGNATRPASAAKQSPLIAAKGTPAIDRRASRRVARRESQPEAMDAAWKRVRVLPGQTLSGIFKAQGYSAGDLAELLATTANKRPLEDLHPGETLWLRSGPNGDFEAIRYGQSPSMTIALAQHTAVAPDTEFAPEPPAGRHVAWGQIHDTLFTAAAHKKVPPFVIAHLAGMFKQAVNFRDLQPGGYFAVIYREAKNDAGAISSGHILAAEIHTPDRSFAAYRFKPVARPAAYYTADGVPLRHPTLLRYPTDFTYMSSPFGMRVDPVVHRYQLHQGIDLAAPLGTPVRAAGNGVITYRGWEHGYGEYITIRNTAAYTTGYAHLARFVPGQHVGSYVKQGEVIGYVGNTGWSTGPHLEYETFVDGTPVNPLTVAAPKPTPLAGALLAEFRHQTAQLVARVRRINAHIERLQASAAAG
ncbi:MAG TPA: M23 family metallopeptidase [Nevskiaceae bacterium]